MRRKLILKCQKCGCDFSPKNQNKNTKFCSRLCFFNSIRGKSKHIEERVTSNFKFCLECGVKFYNIAGHRSNGVLSPYGKVRWTKKLFCSHTCFGAFNGRLRTGMDETKHPRWKGYEVGYYGIHDWVTKHLGQPIGCSVCGLDDINRTYHWANISGKYLRDVNDFKRMCVPCHSNYDHKKRVYESTVVLF